MAANHLSDLSHSIDIHIRLDTFTDRGRERGEISSVCVHVCMCVGEWVGLGVDYDSSL